MSLRIQSAFLRGLFFCENFVPLAAAYGVSLVAWGAVLLVQRDLWDLGLFAAFRPALPMWAYLSVFVGLVQLVLLAPPLRRYLFAFGLAATFLWGWIAVGFYLSIGPSTAQAMYLPAAIGSAWLSLRTSVVQ